MREVLSIPCDFSAVAARRAWDICVNETGLEPDTLIYTSEDIPYVSRVAPELNLIIDDRMEQGTWMVGVSHIPFFVGSAGA